VRVQNVDVGELEALERGFGAFDEMFPRDARVVDFAARAGEGGVGAAPVDLCRC
jgi:hypothetical protein